MQLRFTKMHGIGNDFIVIDGINQRIKLTPERIQKLSDRRFGIGCDQILVVEAPQQADIDFRYRIFNSDGSEVENCGNGARCFAKFVRNKKLTGKSVITVETLCGVMSLSVSKAGDVTVDMGTPELSPSNIPFIAENQNLTYNIDVAGNTIELSAVSMGNPHAVLLIDDVKSAPVEILGPQIEAHKDFPNKVNVGFMAVDSSNNSIDLRVYERGAGETLACGTGACAAVVAASLRQLVDSTQSVTVHLRGGDLHIQWQGIGHPVMMTGPAATVYQGQINL